MNRPVYETQEDRSRERAVAERLAALSGTRALAMPLRYDVDYALVDDQERVRRWLEIKCRTNNRDAYPTYLLSYGKYLKLVALASASGVGVRLAVKWSDALGVLPIPSPHTISFGGRSDRKDWQDREPVALFPICDFRVV